jgi:phosphate transport system substrate-binding protein
VKRLICAALWGLALAAAHADTKDTGDELSDYKRISGVSGNLSSVGSDTLANLMTLWTEAFKREYPNVNIQVQAAGSSTAPPALTEGTSNLGPMSRQMKDKEVEAFETRYGYKPTAIRVAIDALAVYVHKDNPVEALTIPEVDAIFSVTRRCGAESSIDTWGGVGMTGSWAARPIQLYGRNSVSGTYGYFKKVALCSGDFKNTVNEQPGSASVVQAVTASLNGIGYSGIGYRTSGVRPVPLAPRAGVAAVAANEANALDGSYPLARYLFVYVNKKPGQPLPPLEREFMKLVLSKTGQETVVKDGYIAVSSRLANRELRKLD